MITETENSSFRDPSGFVFYHEGTCYRQVNTTYKDTYELINMVDSLKNTMETLAPVLTQGKEIMNMFENFKL